ncbi:RagB/SusD family nutrient uptake outer membrane protein [Puteibacter caeruleilacunae]|nr:RagB/SusD family nutrient uptake outer membrane protein [Puteibacter caeruleilacunae]
MTLNIKNKLNKVVAGMLCLTMLFSSCTDLDEDPGKSRLDPSTLNSEEALEAAVAGSYLALSAAVKWGQFWLNSYGGDDLTTHSGKNKQAMREADLRVLTTTSSRTNTAYDEPYKIIKEVNNIIANADNIEGDKDVINRLIGEAYFLRAYSYFHLTRTFGKVPLKLNTGVEEKLPLAEIVDVYKQIESDLEMAIDLLPVKYPKIRAAIRPNSGSAKAILAKLYLHWAGWPVKDASKYALAASTAKSVIDNADQHGFALVPDMNTLWSTADENRFNTEMVFGVAHTQALGNKYANRHTGKLGYPGKDVGGWAEIFAEIAFMEEFPEGARKDATYRTEVEYKGKVIQWEDFVDEAHPMFLKVTGHLDEVSTKNSTTSMNTYVMRYADLLLIYAEAEGRSGGSSADAWEALNEVRRRAYQGDPDYADITSGDLAELAYTERKWELAGEFKRWDDLVRMERVAQALPNRSDRELVTGSFGDLSPANYFVPIPQSELDKAPWLKE